MNRFALGIGWRIALIVVSAWGTNYLWFRAYPALLLGLLFILHVALFINLFQYVTGVNRKLTRFLESVRYSDFAVAFRADNNLDSSFDQLNQQFNEVLEAFRQARAEKEANLQYLNTIVQHVGVGLLSFDSGGVVELVNQAALRLLGVYRLRSLTELQANHSGLLTILQAGPASTATVYRTDNELEIAVRCTTVRLRGRLVTLVSLQNIRSELQQKELDAWLNLTKVLRHEIMNSVTPIVSLVGTMQQIVADDFRDGLAPAEAVTDLQDALTTIEHRGEGIMRFVDAYRHFTTIPQPRLSEVQAQTLVRNVAALVQPDVQQRGISLTLTLPPNPVLLQADAGQIEMVLLNLLKNAIEALTNSPAPTVQIEVTQTDGRTVIQIADNGPGIEPEAMERIFIPFFTTKKTGSGIGLSLSRQMMQLHGGQLKVESEAGKGSTFRLTF